MLPGGMPERKAPLTAILHAAAQVLDCDSAILGRLSEDRHFLELSVGGTRAGLNVAAVETALGFAVSGLRMPLTVTESILVRALRQERLFVSHDVAEVAGGALPAEMMQAVRDIVGTRSYAVVPIIGRSGALGVLFVDKAGHASFTSNERDTLLAYAERVGEALETEALTDEADRLEKLGAQPAPPPQILLCQPGPEPDPDPGFPPRTILFAQVGGGLLPLHQHLSLPDPAALYSDESERRLRGGEVLTFTIAASPSRPSAESTRRALRWDLPSSIRVPLPEPPAPPPRQLRLSLREAGADGSLLCVVEDLSESESLRRELRLSQEHLSKVLHSVGDVILTVDASGVIHQANEAARLVLGVPPERLPGRSLLSLVASERGRAQLVSLRDRVQRTGYAERYLHLLRGATVVQSDQGDADEAGVRFPAHVSALLLCDDSGRPAGAVLRISDQSQRRRGDQELRRLRSRLVQSERLSALGEMAARIAHEVRNPLVSISAAAQVVAEELPAESPVRGEAVAIGTEVRRLDGILTDFLRFARPRRREVVALDVAKVLREVVELARQQRAGATDKPGVTLRLRTPEGGLWALSDPDGLRQVVWNVLLNACEATLAAPGLGAAGAVALATAPRAVDCEARRHRGGQVLLTIADRGPGVPAALRRRVFDPFFSTKARGTGLGLSICKQILEEQGGRVRLLNRPGGGTRVVIELQPAAELAEPARGSLEDERSTHPDHRR